MTTKSAIDLKSLLAKLAGSGVNLDELATAWGARAARNPASVRK